MASRGTSAGSSVLTGAVGVFVSDIGMQLCIWLITRHQLYRTFTATGTKRTRRPHILRPFARQSLCLMDRVLLVEIRVDEYHFISS